MTIYKNLCILGIGLIGSSILRRVRENAGIAEHTTAYDVSDTVLARAKALDLADIYQTDLAQAVADADCVVICAPVRSIAQVAQEAIPFMKPGSMLTDVGSTRRAVLTEVITHLPDDISYVPAHPMAGTEFSGPDAGFSTLFENRWCLVTPTNHATKIAENTLLDFWHAMGSKTRIVNAQEHDRICAIISHLPHLIAFTICDTADKMSEDYETPILDYAASGFRDFTRIAASDPIMWRDIFLANKVALLETLDRFQKDVKELATAIRDDDSDRIVEAIQKGRRIRESLIKIETN